MSRDFRHGSEKAGFGRRDGSMPWDDAEFDGGATGRGERSGRGSSGVHEEPSEDGGEGWESRRGSGRGARRGSGRTRRGGAGQGTEWDDLRFDKAESHDGSYARRGRGGHGQSVFEPKSAPGDAPDGAPFYPRVRTFARRGDRMSDTLERTFEKHRHAYLLDLERGPGVTMVAAGARLDPRVVFGREAPLIVEVGCGNGEQITAAAAANPDVNFLGFEVWMPGVAKAVSSAVRHYDGLPNLRLADVDALQALPILFADFAAVGGADAASVVLPGDDIDAVRAVFARSRGIHEVPAGTVVVSPDLAASGIPVQEVLSGERPDFGMAPHEHDINPASGTKRGANAGQAGGIITELWTFFADPWPKTRHKKRRLVAPEFAGIAASLLVDGGLWRLATDWADYAWQMRDVIESTPGLENVYAGQRPDEDDPKGLHGGFAPRFEGRVRTAFERRAAREGREVRDLCARRVPRTGQVGRIPR